MGKGGMASPGSIWRVFVGRQTDKVLGLLGTHGRSLHRLLGRLTRSEEATGDLMQELFLRLSRSRGLEEARDPCAYAWRAATNLAFEWRRRRKVRFVPLEGDGREDEPQERPPGRVILDEQIQRVLEATSRLDDLARDVVIMRFIEQESYEQISLRLGKDAGYLRSLCSKSLARLRQMCDDEEPCREQGGVL